MRNIKFLIMGVVFSAAVIIAGCDLSDEVTYTGQLYNANDGSCDITGEALDFYIDDTFVATIEPGESYEYELTAGTHSIDVIIHSTDEVLTDDSDFTIDQEGWWYWYGCNDGTHPSKSVVSPSASALCRFGQSE
jgi:hypothetical protein